MAVGLNAPTNILPVEGIRLSAGSAGIYARKRNDIILLELSEGSIVTGVFTQNLFCAAPVTLAKKHLKINFPHYFLINAGNANAGTGEQGISNSLRTCEALASISKCHFEQVLPFSTGVIGEPLPVEKIIDSLLDLHSNLSSENWLLAAQAIMTTDTVPKAISRKLIIDDKEITITGIAKGAGMIKPDMATMLSFIATDGNISRNVLDQLLKDAVNKSFNRITVDGDTSTNDACMLIATGKANNVLMSAETEAAYSKFSEALTEVCCHLAQAIIRDGEGATKFIEIEVVGGKTHKDCLSVAYKIAESPLVKTAFTASDPNWGRILASIGCAKIDNLKVSKVNIWLDDLCIVENGQRADNYTEIAGKTKMSQSEIKLSVCLGMGDVKETIWTTDLSHEYIKINAEYRT